MDTNTALTVIVTGVVVPVITSILTKPSTPAYVKRWLPIVLSAIGSIGLIVVQVMTGETEMPSSLTQWLTLVATSVGIAQGLYASAPQAWKTLTEKTTPSNSLGTDVSEDKPKHLKEDSHE